MQYNAGKYDCIVVGAGHAGSEAALAASRMGLSTVVFAINLDSIALMACNPSVGGPGKGHMVREIDSLGGQMPINLDKTLIQSRLLNTKKGPAVRALRVQVDKLAYHSQMKYTLESQSGLDIVQEEVVRLLETGGKIRGVVTRTGGIYEAPTVILTTGVYLKGKITIGDVSFSGGPQGLFSAEYLSQSLVDLGIKIGRFKTGTPPRIHRDSVDFSKMVEQPGDEVIRPFSYATSGIIRPQMSCYLTYTNEKTHRIIEDNLHRAPLYTGTIEGAGPRYCPSVEIKVVNYKDKMNHQIFIEPEGSGTKEMYIQGLSTSLPVDVQIPMVNSVKGLENAKVLRFGYAIEYDFVFPTQLKATLEYKEIEGLFMAGQINGTSGYEEAAAQGLMAGINAALKVKEEDPLVVERSQGYIGVLIDDLITKGVTEPYRVLTARSEYRLLLRQDNADLRMTEMGHRVGLIDDRRFEEYEKKARAISHETHRLKSVKVTPTEDVNKTLMQLGTAPINTPQSLEKLLKRPEMDYEKLEILDPTRPDLPEDVVEQVEIAIVYDGYIQRQIRQVEQFKKLENRKIPVDIDYDQVRGIGIEARDRLKAVMPESLGQASRISGVNPADISMLVIYLESLKRSSNV